MTDSPRTPPELPRFGELDAEYEILRELGRGGTAVVYLARERELGRKVAIKVIRSAYIEDEEAAARLVREARTVAGLQHPNIVMLYGTRRLRDHSLALIMQYVEGRTLKAEIRAAGSMPVARVEHVLANLADALAYAHRRRIVHRDLKPENIYIDELGRARLSDFGIARPWGDSSLTLPGAAIGTPAYMSPEQIDGGHLDGRSDLYSLGLVGWEMLTGQRPWAGESLFGVIYKQKHEDLPPLAKLRPGIPGGLRRAIEGALAKEPDDRWPDAEAFLAALDEGRPRARAVMDSSAPIPAGSEGLVATSADGAPFEAPEPDPEALTVRYRRPNPAEGAAISPVPVPAGTPSPAPPEPAFAAEEARPATWHGVVAPAGHMARPAQRRRTALAAAVLLLFLVGTAVLIGVNQWGVDRGRALGPRDVAAAAAEPPSPPPAAAAAVPARVVAVSGIAQEGLAGDTLAEPLVVRVEDASGRPVADVPVRFAVAAGAGALLPLAERTDAAGRAQARWVPAAPGLHAIEAGAGDATEPVRFQVRALPRPAGSMVRVSPERYRGIAGEAASEPLIVRVLDDRGRPLPGVPVSFAVRSGEGRVGRAPVTDEDGTVQATWVLGAEGEQEVVATVAGIPGDTIVFRGTGEPAPLAVRRAVAAGGTHTCLLAGNGAVACWGGNDSGQLGDGSLTRRAGPVAVKTAEPLAMLSAGVSHTCGVGRSGSVFCWGANSSGQLGDGRTAARTEPGRIASGERFNLVAAGMAHTCGLSAAGALYCWGRNEQGQLGDGTRTSRTAPAQVAGGRTWRGVAPGWAHTCALTRDGTAFCWGRNSSGELGDGSTTDRAEPRAVAGGHRFTAIATGSAHTCGLRADGTVLCWGQNRNGQLGSGSDAGSLAPVAVATDQPFAALTLGGLHSCGLARDGTAFCWGRNNYGQLGDGSLQDRTAPVPVEGGRRFSALNASGAHTCGTTTAGQELCWGLNLEGQLGDGTRNNQPRPVAARRPG